MVRSAILAPSRKGQPRWASTTSSGMGGAQAQPSRRRAQATRMELNCHCAQAARERNGAGYKIADSPR
eukprot:5240651-Pyramimonas_sp.AAC.1